ncbi:MAG: TRAP transporter small permease subunit [Deltaproteobacteria bacterium]|nr:TRAP transporter small permease subunit [Deltaproteobacteria bacterium]
MNGVFPNNENGGLAGALDKFVLGVGQAAAWLNGLLVLVIVLQVTLRYVFKSGLVALEELEWHLYAESFLLGLSYSLTRGSHVRMDLLYERFSSRVREWVEIVGLVALVLPFTVVFFIHGVEFTWRAYELGEYSSAPLGLPFRWIIKSAIPVSCVLLFLAALARILRGIQTLRKGDEYDSQ